MNFVKYAAIVFLFSMVTSVIFDIKEYIKEADLEEKEKENAFKFIKENTVTVGLSNNYNIIRSIPDLGAYYIVRSDEFLYSGEPVRLQITKVIGDFVENKAEWIDIGFSKMYSRMFVALCSMATDSYETLSYFSITTAGKKEDLCLFTKSSGNRGKYPEINTFPPELISSIANSELDLPMSIQQGSGESLREKNKKISIVKWRKNASGAFSTDIIDDCCDELNGIQHNQFKSQFNLIYGGFALFEIKKYPHDEGKHYRLFSYSDGVFSKKIFIEVRREYSGMDFIYWLDNCRMSVKFRNEKSQYNIGVFDFCKPMPIEITI